MAYLAVACRGVIGLVFAVSLVSKSRSGPAFREFTSWLASLPLPLVRRRATAVATAVAEAAIVVLTGLPWTAPAGLILAAVTLAVFTTGTWLAVTRGADQPCQCFGTSATPLGRRHVVRDVVLCIVAVTGAVGGAVAATGAGAGAGGTAGPRPAGIVVSLVAGLIIALFVVFLDDLAALFAGPGGERENQRVLR